MLAKINPTKTSSWKKLEVHFDEMKQVQMRDLFQGDSSRFHKFSLKKDGFLLDFSKNIITEKTLDLLIDLAKECQLENAIEQLFNGSPINETENRPVLHTALTNVKNTPIFVDDEDVMPFVNTVLTKMEKFSKKVITGEWKGYTGKKITDIVNIGIGGSDLGPVMVTEALKFYRTRLNVYFVSNVDGTHITETLKSLCPETTLFIVASKSFTTQETMTNAFTARKWFLERAKKEQCIQQHFVAASTNTMAVTEFGILSENMFEFKDWVGGRYSLTSAIGLSICMAIGFDKFQELRQGYFDMNEHFRTTDFRYNMPVVLALIGVWYNNFFNAETEAILPYDQYLHRFPAYFQQGNMESNGKSVDRNGDRVDYATGPIIWGESGTNGQHAFYQLIHQGTRMIPCDFIATAQSLNPQSDHHEKLIANVIAQSEALMKGKTSNEAFLELKQEGKTQEEIEQLLPYKRYKGNQPSNTILLKKITPQTLGQLIALYEHKIFVQGVIWNIFSFDQWGVELGKQLAKKILNQLTTQQEIEGHDSSTTALIQQFMDWRE